MYMLFLRCVYLYVDILLYYIILFVLYSRFNRDRSDLKCIVSSLQFRK